MAARNNFPVPTTPEAAETFLQAVMGLSLCRSDGCYEGEVNGEIVGYNRLKGTNYGGSDEPLPPGARAAFVMSEGRPWQKVFTHKNTRGRS